MPLPRTIGTGRALGRSNQWTPANVAGLLAWYDGKDAFRANAPGDVIASWPVYRGSGGAPLTQATTANRPTVAPTLDGLMFDGSNDVLSAAFTATQPATTFLVGRLLTNSSPKYMQDGAAVNTLGIYQSTAGVFSLNNGAGAAASITPNNLPFVQSAIWRSGANQLSNRLNGGTAVTGNGSNATHGGLTLGASAVPNNWSHLFVQAFLMYSGALSTTDELRIIAYLQQRYRTTDTLGPLNLVFEGDSRTALYTYPTKVGNYVLATSYVGTNVGTGGETAANMSTQVSQTTSTFDSIKGNVAIFWAGVNDNRQGTTSGSTIYGYISTWVAGVKAGGFKAVVCTEIDSQDSLNVSNNWTTTRAALNTLIRANSAGANAVCDLAALPQFQDATNTLYYNTDKIHLSPHGDAVVALRVLDTLRGMA